MIKAWADEYDAGAAHQFPVSVINDLPEDWNGRVQFRLLQGDKVLQEKSQPCKVAGLGQTELVFDIAMPGQPGRYQLEGSLIHPSHDPIRSVREFSILTQEERGATTPK